MDERVSIRAHYERFPATIKGALVLRGEDADPHQVWVERCRIAEVAGAAVAPVAVEDLTLDVAPHRDLFVPFEFPLTELNAGWYGIECDVTIDGVPATVRPGSRFPVAWPRATVRRGSVSVGRKLETEREVATIDQVDLGGDSIRITYSAETPLTMSLSADGAMIPTLESEFDADAGRGRVVGYPVLKTQSTLTIQAEGADPLEVRLD
jgi:hypothetical protein